MGKFCPKSVTIIYVTLQSKSRIRPHSEAQQVLILRTTEILIFSKQDLLFPWVPRCAELLSITTRMQPTPRSRRLEEASTDFLLPPTATGKNRICVGSSRQKTRQAVVCWMGISLALCDPLLELETDQTVGACATPML